MARQGIFTGSSPNDGTGDSLLVGASKINENFLEIYSTFGDGSTLTGGVGNGTSLVSYASSAGIATYATSSGIATYATSSGISTYATNAGYSTSSGVSTSSQGLTGTPNLNVGVVTAASFIGQVNSGVGTITTLSGTNATYTTGNFTTGNIVTGVVTNISGTNINYTGITTVGSFNIGATQVISSGRQLQNIASLDATTTTTIETAIANAPNTFTDINVSGLSTFAGITTVTGVTLFAKQLDVAGVSTFAGITTVTGVSLFSKQLSVSGVTTLGTLRVSSGIVTATSGIITYYGDGSKLTGISAGGIGTQWVTNASGIHTFANVAIGTNNPQTALYLDGVLGFKNSNIRIGSNQTLSGATGTSNISIGDFSGASVSAGIRNVLIGDYSNAFGLDGSYNVMIGYRGSSQGSHNIQIGEYITGGSGSNQVVIGNGDFTNNYNFGAPDSSKDLQLAIGVNTTGNNISDSKYWLVGNEQFNIGFGTDNPTSKLTVGGDVKVAGVVTATTFVGNFSGSITDATNLTGGTANASSLNVSGIATISQGRIQVDASSNLRFGNVAAGSGSGRNIAIGDQVLVSLSGGSGRNIGIGELSYYDTTTGQYNIGVGERAGQKVSTGSYNVILGAYDGNSGGLDIRTSSRNVVIADGEGNIRQYINSSGNVGIKTTVVTEALTVSGIVSATSFYGTLNAGQLTGTLPAIDGSALIGVVASGTGITIEEDGTPVGTAGTINFGSNINVTFASGIATVSGVSSVSTATTAFNLAGSPNLNVGVVTATKLISNTSIGIGTVNPSEEFHIYGTSPDVLIEGSSPTGASQLLFKNNVGNFGFIAKVGSTYNNINYPTISPNSLSIFNIDNGNLILGTNNLERFRILGSNGNIGIGTTNATSRLTVSGDVLVSGAVTASSFSGSGSSLTNLPAGQLTGTLPALDGSALLNVTASGTGIVIDDDNVNVGSAVTVNFGTGLDVAFSAGVATITASGGSLQSRTTVSGVTTSIANLGIGNTNITGFKSYALMKVGLSTAGWLRLYTDSASRDADVSRSIGEDPAVGSGVIAEVITTGISTTQIISPFVMGGNLDNPADTTIYASIKNLSGFTQSITTNLTILQLEA